MVPSHDASNISNYVHFQQFQGQSLRPWVASFPLSVLWDMLSHRWTVHRQTGLHGTASKSRRASRGSVGVFLESNVACLDWRQIPVQSQTAVRLYYKLSHRIWVWSKLINSVAVSASYKHYLLALKNKSKCKQKQKWPKSQNTKHLQKYTVNWIVREIKKRCSKYESQ